MSTPSTQSHHWDSTPGNSKETCPIDPPVINPLPANQPHRSFTVPINGWGSSTKHLDTSSASEANLRHSYSQAVARNVGDLSPIDYPPLNPLAKPSSEFSPSISSNPAPSNPSNWGITEPTIVGTCDSPLSRFALIGLYFSSGLSEPPGIFFRHSVSGPASSPQFYYWIFHPDGPCLGFGQGSKKSEAESIARSEVLKTLKASPQKATRDLK
jgi:hypothetical protein